MFRMVFIFLLVCLCGTAKADYILEVVNTGETATSGQWELRATWSGMSGDPGVTFDSAAFDLVVSELSGTAPTISATGFSATGLLITPAPPFYTISSTGTLPSTSPAPGAANFEYSAFALTTIDEFSPTAVLATFNFTTSGTLDGTGGFALGIAPTNGNSVRGLAQNGVKIGDASSTVTAYWGTAVPEPGSVGMLALGGLLMLTRRRRS